MGSERRRIVAVDPASPDGIQTAVTDLAGTGGTVHLLPGEHVVRATVALPSHVTLLGAGADATTVTLAPGSNCHMFTNDDHAKGNRQIELRAFRLEGNLRTQHKPPDHQPITFACGGYFKRVRHLVVDGVVAHGIRQTAFHFNHCKHVRLFDLDADELGWSGVSTSGTDDIVLRRVVVTNSGLDVRHSGIHLDGGVGAYVEAVVDGCTGNGIMVDSKFSPMSDVVVRGVGRRSMRGLSLSGDHENALSNVVLSGDYSENRECGLLVSNASNVFIVDATIAGNAKAGIVVQGKRGSAHCVVAGTAITGNPEPVVERDGNHLAYITESVSLAMRPDAAPLAEEAAPAPAAAPPVAGGAAALGQRLRGRVARTVTRATGSATAAALPRAADVPDDDSFDGTCNVCGERQTFVRRNLSLREGYRCSRCKASLRYRGQADAILRSYARHGAATLAELSDEAEFSALDFWEPGVLGPFRAHFTKLPGYVMSDFWPDVAPGEEREGVRCEDIMALTFPDDAFDLVVTSDIFEHVRHPFVGFAEVHRVLRRGGRHIFSIPIQEPWRAVTVARVDTSGPDDVHLLEPRYHLGPGNSQHIVYNDFGRDLVDGLVEVGFDTEVVHLESANAEASRLLTLSSTKR